MNGQDAPPVSMLWEAHDPDQVLASRFGFESRQSAGHWVAATVGAHWGVPVDGCERIVMSDHNALAWVATPTGRLVVKWSVDSECFPQLAETARLTAWLGSRGLPISEPVRTPDGRLQIEVDGASACLQREVEGDLLDCTDNRQVRSAGAALARLQDALAGYPDADRLVRTADRPAPLAARIGRWLDDYAEHVPATASDSLRRLVDAASAEPLPTQLLHYDFRAANVLCAGPAVAAVLDFELVRPDHRVVELARSAVLLGTRYRDWGPVTAEIHREFVGGYQSVRRLTAVEASWWDAVLLWQALLAVPPGHDPTGWGAAALRLARPG